MDLVGAFGLGAVATAVVGLFLLKHYLPAYLSEKGKNLATKEDIAEITREVERVRHEYNAILEELKARHRCAPHLWIVACKRTRKRLPSGER